MRLLILSLGGISLMAAASTSGSTEPSFNKEVLPILQQNCQTCHRPGEAAPMSFLTYQSTRPWAKAIKTAVLAKKMPPWFADPHVGKFSNERTLSKQNIDMLVLWADTGAKEGNAKDAPKPINWVDGWGIKPDRVFTMPTSYEIPANGVIEYTDVIIPTGFTEDTWVQMSEVRPGDRRHVHHIMAFVREPGNPWLREGEPGVPFVPGKSNRGGGSGEVLGMYVPGSSPNKMLPGQARLIKAGSDIIISMHYVTDGTASSDRSSVGIIIAKQPPQVRILSLSSGTHDFGIPPGDPNYEMTSVAELEQDATLINLYPHMHLRGKNAKYTAVYPTGEKEELLWVPKYDFAWQTTYELDKPKVLPKGTRIICTAHFDNSANNPFNPDPTRTVPYGDQTWDEMKNFWFDLAVPVTAGKQGLIKAINDDQMPRPH